MVAAIVVGVAAAVIEPMRAALRAVWLAVALACAACATNGRPIVQFASPMTGGNDGGGDGSGAGM